MVALGTRSAIDWCEPVRWIRSRWLKTRMRDQWMFSPRRRSFPLWCVFTNGPRSLQVEKKALMNATERKALARSIRRGPYRWRRLLPAEASLFYGRRIAIEISPIHLKTTRPWGATSDSVSNKSSSTYPGWFGRLRKCSRNILGKDLRKLTNTSAARGRTCGLIGKIRLPANGGFGLLWLN